MEQVQNSKKSNYFKKEETYLKNKSYIEDYRYLIEHLPDYFFEIEAASTGKYHPSYAQGEGGLLRHTKAAVRIAYELLQDPVIGEKYSSKEQDLMLIALTLHDGLKLGKTKNRYTQVEHPVLAANYIKEMKENLHFTDEEIEFMGKVISSHMGPWNKDFDGNEVLPIPKTKYENFVHMCDYLASRKCLLLDFDQNNNIIG